MRREGPVVILVIRRGVKVCPMVLEAQRVCLFVKYGCNNNNVMVIMIIVR
jgi:hypothetical protein